MRKAHQEKGQATLHILSAPAHDTKINQLKVALQGGHCNAGKTTLEGNGAPVAATSASQPQSCPRVLITGPGVSADHPAPYTIGLPAKDIADQNLLRFARDLILPLSANTQQSYHIGLPGDCHGKQFFDTTVHVHPAVTWKGEISLGYGFDTLDKSHPQ